MGDFQGEIILYGLKHYKETIEFVIKKLRCEKNVFEIKLILTEALSNAYKHGNNSDDSKPIYLRYWNNNEVIKFEVQDSGDINSSITFSDKVLEDENIMNESGRGLFLIKCFVDNVEFENNVLRLYINKI
jgi:serine/threonine-protein kinase RsbW